jgi:hypothetical protein
LAEKPDVSANSAQGIALTASEGEPVSATTLRSALIRVALATVLLLLVPAVAMQFTAEVSWGPGDFVIAGLLLFGAGSLAVLGLRHVTAFCPRIALVLGIALGLGLIWAELAVGLFA